MITYNSLDEFIRETGIPSKVIAARVKRSESYISKVRNGRIVPSLPEALILSHSLGWAVSPACLISPQKFKEHLKKRGIEEFPLPNLSYFPKKMKSKKGK